MELTNGGANCVKEYVHDCDLQFVCVAADTESLKDKHHHSRTTAR